MNDITGFMPAIVTAFTPEGQTDRNAMRRIVAYQLEKRVTGFYVCGTTGQGLHMTVGDRKKAAEAVIGEVAGAAPVIVHIGSMVPADAAELARHAVGLGAAAVSSVLPPAFASVAEIVAYYAAIARAVPDVPLYPYLANPTIDVPVLIERVCEIPTVAGTKYTGPNMYELRQVIEIGRSLARSGRWTVMAGMDEQCVFAAMTGADGNIGSSLNVIPGAYRVIWELVNAGEHARAYEVQQKANAVLDVMKTFDYPAALRYGLNLLGLECSPPCSPGRPLSEDRKEALKKALEQAGFFELAEL